MFLFRLVWKVTFPFKGCLGPVESREASGMTSVDEGRDKITTHNKLLYSSMQLVRALVRRIVM
jgi:hypothetical protein